MQLAHWVIYPGGMRAAVLLLALAAALPPADALPRSKAARAEFVRAHPCPATGKSRGACPGWQVDHIQPLKCGGTDAVENMQWLTVRDHAEKTKREAKLCRAPQARRAVNSAP